MQSAAFEAEILATAIAPNGIIDALTNGLDDNGIRGVDDLTEVEASMPYPVPIKGIVASA